ncbi:MAG: four helix bundle protein [Flavisolibacter sp.]
MATVQKFEDLKVWQKARELSQKVYPLTFIEPICSDFRYKDQIRGTLGSIMDNAAEGFGRGSRLKFINGLNTSRGETNELKSQSYRGLDNKYFSEEQFSEFYFLADEITKMGTSLISYLNKSNIKGQRFKDRI